MDNGVFNYREVIAEVAITETEKLITINTGGTQSTLQDIRFLEKSGGYGYKEAFHSTTRNRFILWHIDHDILELTEYSLDLNLYGCRIKYKFIDTPITDGISITETDRAVVILVPTVCSVHKFQFPHPNCLQVDSERNHPDLTAPSIFAYISDAGHVQKNHLSYFLNYPVPITTASYFSKTYNQSIFSYAFKNGLIVLVKETDNAEQFSILELSEDSLVPKFLSNLAGILRRKMETLTVLSLCFITFDQDDFLIAACQDFHLRIWSIQKSECVCSYRFLSDKFDEFKVSDFNAKNIIVKTSIGLNSTKFVVLTSIDQQNQYTILKPDFVDNEFRISKFKTISSSEDVIDFALEDNYLWSVWRTIDGDTRVSTVQICSEESISWKSVLLEPNCPVDESAIMNNPDIDPKQAYLSYIFQPGRFPKSVILKSINLYKKYSMSTETNIPINQLKRKVCLAVEDEIQIESKDYEINDDEYLEISCQCWAKFYSCCVQYLIAASKPVGLVLLPNVSAAVLLKKSVFSFLRPIDQIEFMLECSDLVTSDHIEGVLNENDAKDLIHLTKLINYLDKNIPEDYQPFIERNLSNFTTSTEFCNNFNDFIVKHEEKIDSKTLNTFLDSFSSTFQILVMIKGLLELIGPNAQNNDADLLFERLESIGTKKSKTMVLNGLFSSYLGVSFVCESLSQLFKFRLRICENLLYFQLLLLKISQNIESIISFIQKTTIPKTIQLIQIYYGNNWLSNELVFESLVSEKSRKVISTLKLSDLHSDAKCLQNMQLILQQFIVSCGNFNVRLNENTKPQWNYCLLGYLKAMMYLLWPKQASLLIEKWMLANSQCTILQNYCRLANSWSIDSDNYQRCFLHAVSYLIGGSALKAFDLFREAAERIFDKCDDRKLTDYFFQVINLFESYGMREYAIKMADQAIDLSAGDASSLAILYSIQFNHRLALGQYKEAYNCMLQNPDKERYKDCLRQLIKELIENKEIRLFLSFSFENLFDEVVEILHSRAKVIDSNLAAIYYSVLCAFFMKNKKFWEAGNIMYEQAISLNVSSIADLRKQVNYYLACTNILSVCEKDQAFVIKPILKSGQNESRSIATRNTNSDVSMLMDTDCTVLVSTENMKNFEFLSLRKVREEAELQIAKLKLSGFNAKQAELLLKSGPEEVLPLLLNENLITTALKLADYYRLSKAEIFDHLVLLCIRLDKENSQTSWNFLLENDLNTLRMVDGDPAKVCWDMLRSLIDQHQPEFCTDVYQVVVKRLISLDIQIPQWILIPYKKRNAGQLISVYVDNGRLHEASLLSIEYIYTALGYFGYNSLKRFSIEHSLGAKKSSPLCLPMNVFEYLLNKLYVEARKDNTHTKLFNKMFGAVQLYVNQCKAI